jgi:putative transposase
MTTPARARYTGYRFPAEIIGHAVWLYFRFPLGLRMVEELLAARGIIVSHETVRQWARKFGQQFANRIRRRLPRVGDKWHLDEVVLKIAGVKHWLWRAVDQTGIVLDVLVRNSGHSMAKNLRTLALDRASAACRRVSGAAVPRSGGGRTGASRQAAQEGVLAGVGVSIATFPCQENQEERA